MTHGHKKGRDEVNTVTDDGNPLIGWFHSLIERTAEQTAQRTVEKVQATLRTQNEDRQCNAGQAAQLLGYVRPDGSPNVPAFKMYRERHPDFANLGRQIGRRWYWQRSDIEAWIKAHPRGGRVSGA